MVLLKDPFQSFGRDWDREREILFSFFLRPKAYVIYALKKKKKQLNFKYKISKISVRVSEGSCACEAPWP